MAPHFFQSYGLLSQFWVQWANMQEEEMSGIESEWPWAVSYEPAVQEPEVCLKH